MALVDIIKYEGDKGNAFQLNIWESDVAIRSYNALSQEKAFMERINALPTVEDSEHTVPCAKA